MMIRSLTTGLCCSLFIALTFALPLIVNGQDDAVPAALDFTMETLDGEELNLGDFKGQVVVIVNVASKCGYTPQYEQLQELHEQHSEDGLVILGVPCNQFGGQEPGSSEEIASFCEENYGVEFTMLAKVDVKGDDQSDLYQHLTSLDLQPAGKGDIKWNFEKIVIGRDGVPVGRYSSKVKPDSDTFVSVIKEHLESGASTGHYSHRSEKLDRVYYLFKKEVPLKNSDKTSTIYFFAKDPNNEKGTPLAEVPADRMVAETKTGMLVLKKKQ